MTFDFPSSAADLGRYPRDMVGYGRNAPDPRWPGGANVAVQFVLNYEEGGERNILHGDECSEFYLTEHLPGPGRAGARHDTAESIFEYGSRAGFWRLWHMFNDRKLPLTVFGVGLALARNPEAVAAMREADWEIASHGLRWIDHRHMSEDEERAYIDASIAMHDDVCGAAPRGWYMGRTSDNTVALLAERGLAYVSDSYSDDLPYRIDTPSGPQLMLPYTLETNDMRFLTPQGFGTSDDFYGYLRDTFDVLWREGDKGRPRMMNIGLHTRISGRPGRAAAVERFLDYLGTRDRTWITTRVAIADHWINNVRV